MNMIMMAACNLLKGLGQAFKALENHKQIPGSSRGELFINKSMGVLEGSYS